ncbi:MAG TPA: PAS domain-containing protein, partial [Rhodocyclaceae bacterium]|nr:PAS domain-containing protein [Rhodocyclaceae bacterium]
MSILWLAIGMLTLVPLLIVQQRRIDALRRKQPDLPPSDDCCRFAQELIEAMPCPVFYKSLDGRYLGCNGAFAEYLGRPRDEIVGRTVYDVSPRELADRYAAADADLFAEAGTQTYEVQVRRADGSLREVLMHKAAFAGAGRALPGVIGVIIDITERKLAE